MHALVMCNTVRRQQFFIIVRSSTSHHRQMPILEPTTDVDSPFLFTPLTTKVQHRCFLTEDPCGLRGLERDILWLQEEKGSTGICIPCLLDVESRRLYYALCVDAQACPNEGILSGGTTAGLQNSTECG